MRVGRRIHSRWKRAAITGGSAGIGLGFARVLAASGTNLVLVARDRQRLEDEARRIQDEYRVAVDMIPADLAHEQELRRVVEDIARRDLDLLVNNVGGGVFGAFHDRDWESIEAEVATNLWATLRLSHCVISQMRDRRRGTIVNVAAGNAFYPTPYGAVYGAAKSFVVSLGQAMNYELRGSGIGVTSVCPGFTRTEGPIRHGFDVDRVPSWWWTDPQDVARVALRAAARHKPVVSPGLSNILGAPLGRHLPRSLWLPAVARTQLGLRGPRRQASGVRPGVR